MFTQRLNTKDVLVCLENFYEDLSRKTKTESYSDVGTTSIPTTSRSTLSTIASDLTDNVGVTTTVPFLSSVSQNIGLSLDQTTQKEFIISSSILEVVDRNTTSISYEENEGGDLLCILTIYPINKISHVHRKNWWMHA